MTITRLAAMLLPFVALTTEGQATEPTGGYSVLCIVDEAKSHHLNTGEIDDEYSEQPSSFSVLPSGAIVAVNAPFCQFVTQVNRTEGKLSFYCRTMEPDSEALISLDTQTYDFSKFVHLREKAIITMSGHCIIDDDAPESPSS